MVMARSTTRATDPAAIAANVSVSVAVAVNVNADVKMMTGIFTLVSLSVRAAEGILADRGDWWQLEKLQEKGI